MKKGITIILIFTFILLIKEIGIADPLLKSSYPQDGEIIENYQFEQVELNFNTQISQGKTYIEDEEGYEYEPIHLQIEDQTLIAKFPEGIPNGSYQLHWNTLGPDGHKAEGTIFFTVEGDETNTEKGVNLAVAFSIILAVAILTIVILIFAVRPRK